MSHLQRFFLLHRTSPFNSCQHVVKLRFLLYCYIKEAPSSHLELLNRVLSREFSLGGEAKVLLKAALHCWKHNTLYTWF